MKSIAVYNVKGGVSKTASSVNLAYYAARSGARVLLWDFDPQGAATYYLGASPAEHGGTKNLLPENGSLHGMIETTDYPNLDLFSASFSLIRNDFVLGSPHDPGHRFQHVLAALPDVYDYVIIDCAPGISLIAESVFQSVDRLLVPVVPTTLSVLALDQLLDFLATRDEFNVPLMSFFTLVDWRKTLHRDLVLEQRADKESFLMTVIPSATEVERMGVHRAPIGEFAGKSRAALAFEELWREISESMTEGKATAPIATAYAAYQDSQESQDSASH
ncbi:MAG: ParA family protein [Kiloniellales bacterium]